MKGYVKTRITKRYEHAEQKNGKWQPVGDLYRKEVNHYNKHGFLQYEEIFLSTQQNEYPRGSVIYQYINDSLTQHETRSDKDELLTTTKYRYQGPLSYSTSETNTINNEITETDYVLNTNYSVVVIDSRLYDSLGKIIGDGHYKTSYVNDGPVKKITTVVTSSFAPTDTIITKNTVLRKDEKGNIIEMLSKTAGKQFPEIYYFDYIFYDE